MPNDPEKLTLEKMKVIDRLLSIEEFIKEGKEVRRQINETLATINLRLHNTELMIHGDPEKSDKYTRDGMNRRLEDVEAYQRTTIIETKVVKDNFLAVAVGAITLAVGAFILWLWNLIWSNVGKH